ncbi:phospholipase D-like domain-containing protein [Sorangium sp. So ce260]|uniref:phospholipase D-like domain-containing protein n=1 Tax=Sorangium sp. So ce260 TaxID=3133291 RepID=UPI003F609EC6
MNDAARTVALGPERLAGMFFVPGAPVLPAWIDPNPLPGRTAAGPLVYLATTGPDPGAPLRAALLDLIDHAEEKVFLASFLFADRAVTEALARKAERLRGGVYVLTALDRSFPADVGEPEDDEPGKREQIDRNRRLQHFDNLRALAKAGAWLRSAADLHAKLCVVDDRVAFVTSANATEAAYQKNPENGLLVRDPTLARELGRAFARVFLHRVTHQSPPAADLDVKEFRPAPGASWKPMVVRRPDAAVATIGRDEASLLHATLELINSARRELVLTAFSAVDLRDHPVGLALRAAIARGVRILAVFPPDDRRSDRRETGAWLFGDAPDGAVTVAGCPRTHAKAMIADGAHTLVWTGNLDGRHGYQDGFEVGLATDRPDIASAARAHVIALALAASHRAVFNPTPNTLADAYGAPSPLAGDWTLVLPPGSLWTPATLVELLRSVPVTFTRRSSELVVRIGEAAELISSVDVQRRTLRIERSSDRPSNGAPFDGYLRGCRLTVTGGGREMARPENRRIGRRGRG